MFKKIQNLIHIYIKMSEINTFFIADPRYADIQSNESVAVKDGPASVIPQAYTQRTK